MGLNESNIPSRIQAVGAFLLRYGLVLVLGWIGAMKFTAYEAEGIKPLVETSPLMSWMYKFLSIQATSNLFGVAEITAAVLIAIRPVSARLSATGSVIVIFTFLATLTFLFSLPGWEKSLGGFPALSSLGSSRLSQKLVRGPLQPRSRLGTDCVSRALTSRVRWVRLGPVMSSISALRRTASSTRLSSVD